MKKILQFIIQPTTIAGIITLLGLLFTISPELAIEITKVIAGLAGGGLVIYNQKK